MWVRVYVCVYVCQCVCVTVCVCVYCVCASVSACVCSRGRKKVQESSSIMTNVRSGVCKAPNHSHSFRTLKESRAVPDTGWGGRGNGPSLLPRKPEIVYQSLCLKLYQAAWVYDDSAVQQCV